MKKQAVNPYLPFWEHIPDGEPHVFDGRVYVYGSNDGDSGTTFCQGDYEGWSAPVEDLSDWKYEGIIYRKDQDPINGAPYDKNLPPYEKPIYGSGMRFLYAPDVAKGKDGRYYLYYALDYVNAVSVAVCDTPAGQYEFLGYVTKEDGSIPKEGRWFDPAILVEESGNYLYYGFCPKNRFPGMEDQDLSCGRMVRLADDMHTIVGEPVCIGNGVESAKGTSFEEHPFFEASSIRHLGNLYYFVYSSLQGHELCYATSTSPEGPFTYRGVVISNADLGYQGNTQPVNYYGNNHGGLEMINGKLYIFWHRQTHGTEFARQGCADEVTMLPDGTIPQTEVTSCGLNGGPLLARGRYETYIACQLMEKDRANVAHVVSSGPGNSLPVIPENWPYITEEENPNGEHGLKPYIHNMKEGATAGFKYFAFDGTEQEITMELRGKGVMEATLDRPDGEVIAKVTTESTKEDAGNGVWSTVSANLKKTEGSHALFFTTLNGTLDFASFEMK